MVEIDVCLFHDYCNSDFNFDVINVPLCQIYLKYIVTKTSNISIIFDGNGALNFNKLHPDYYNFCEVNILFMKSKIKTIKSILTWGSYIMYVNESYTDRSGMPRYSNEISLKSNIDVVQIEVHFYASSRNWMEIILEPYEVQKLPEYKMKYLLTNKSIHRVQLVNLFQ